MDDPLVRLGARAAERPTHPAVVEEGAVTSYASFLDRVRLLAGALARCRPQPKVLIHLPQGRDAYAAMFATAMAGGVYAPTNVGAPAAKQRLILEQFGPDVVVGHRDAFARLVADPAGPRPELIDPDETMSGRPLDHALPPHDLAYVIFTSGSTGTPKGVMVPRSALHHYVDWTITALEVTPADRWSQHPNIAFDVSVTDIYGALCGGATLFPLTNAEHRLMPALAIRDLRLTVWNSVPSVLALMMRAGHVTARHLAPLRLANFLGEPLLPEHLDALFAARPDLVVQNTYGPTETTVACTAIRLASSTYRPACRSSVAIGDPLPGTAIHLVNGDGPDHGELVVVGPQLARGYWNDPRATARAFRPLEVGGTVVPAYYTGDWGERINGHLFFAGRQDSQVKLHGYRLELGEVNAALRQCGYPTAASALVDGVLHAFLETNRAVDAPALRDQLARLLEPHAVPACLHAIAHLPRNANDKIDLAALVASTAAPR